MTRRPPTVPVRVHMNAPRNRSSAPVSILAKSRLNVASSAACPVMPSELSSSSVASAAHSPIAVKERAPASTAAIPTASTPATGCRTPRGSRGSGTFPIKASRHDSRASCRVTGQGMSEDGIGGCVLGADGWCESFHPSPTGHTHHPRHADITAGQSPIHRLCRGPGYPPRATQPLWLLSRRGVWFERGGDDQFFFSDWHAGAGEDRQVNGPVDVVTSFPHI